LHQIKIWAIFKDFFLDHLKLDKMWAQNQKVLNRFFWKSTFDSHRFDDQSSVIQTHIQPCMLDQARPELKGAKSIKCTHLLFYGNRNNIFRISIIVLKLKGSTYMIKLIIIDKQKVLSHIHYIKYTIIISWYYIINYSTFINKIKISLNNY